LHRGLLVFPEGRIVLVYADFSGMERHDEACRMFRSFRFPCGSDGSRPKQIDI
jgi:hypothetical protein